MNKARASIQEYGAGGHIDVAYGVFDRPGPDEPNVDVPTFEPIVPQEQVSTQLSLDRPPVDDPDYVPSNVKSLELALSTLASYVPDDEVHKFYLQVRDKVEKLVDAGLLKSKYSGDEVMKQSV